MNKIEEGMTAPNFKGTNEKGENISLSTYKGKKLVLYFYPKDDTPGCTKEACSLRDGYGELKKRGVEILGVSADNEKKHGKFIEKYSLPFSLLADTALETIKAYGVWGPKKFMGREYDGIHRTTFIIDESGIVLKRIDKVDTNNHAKQILDLL
ncbi:MAG: thioredoxin-dependent thiol peroxidase [Flavobacteriales bacterium]